MMIFVEGEALRVALIAWPSNWNRLLPFSILPVSQSIPPLISFPSETYSGLIALRRMPQSQPDGIASGSLKNFEHILLLGRIIEDLVISFYFREK